MHDHTTHSDSHEGRADCGPGKRNRFFPGKTMKAEEFALEQDYGIGRRRLINRAVLGWGVVYGFALEQSNATPPPLVEGGAADDASPTPGKVVVKPGLALDACGREILLEHAATLGADNTFVWSGTAGDCRPRALPTIQPGEYILAVHYAERGLGDVDLSGGCGCPPPQKSFTCETVVFSLRPRGERCPCGEPACRRQCDCGGDTCANAGRGPHACLCRWVEASPAASAPPSYAWNGYEELGPAHGVDLACLTVTARDDKCDPLGFTVSDGCSPRRIVKNNDLLYDLIRGCDLTRIESISWSKWHRAKDVVPWNVFFDEMLADATPAGPFGEDGDLSMLTKLTVTFSGPVDLETVTRDCFALKFTVSHDDTGWWDTRTVTISDVKPVGPETDEGGAPLPQRTFALCVPASWLEEVTPPRSSKLKNEGATIQVEIYGDYILDCHGQAIDANARGLNKGPKGDFVSSGNGSPGGTFVSVFRVSKYAK